MKTFKQFITEASMPDELAGRASVRQSGEGGRVYRNRKKSEAETRRVKAIGGGKTAPVTYKDRKDIGTQKKRETREQQPQKERGSAALSAKEAQRKAYRERKARESGGSSAGTSRDKEKTASKLLSTKKPKKPVSPDYKPAKASGKTRAERDKIRGEGEKMLKGIFKKQETDRYKKETGQNPDAKGRTKILGRVNQRMK
tara:strand:+ start:467 stop:1063 length:597 start_codon:yes stop_codon:yes gene_type:complete